MRVHHVSPDGRRPNDHAVYRGAVEMQAIVTGDQSATHNVLEIAFKRGARTKMHTHESDQILIITEGRGVVGTTDERHDVGPGDIVVIAAGERHFHGAADGSDMTHYAIQASGQPTIVEG